MKKILALLVVSLLFVTTICASAESKNDDNIIAGFIIIDDAQQTIKNVEKKYNTKLSEAVPLEYIDNTLITLWGSEKDMVGVAVTTDDKFLSLLQLNRDAKSIVDDLEKKFKFPITDTLKRLLDESSMIGKTFSAYIVQNENYYVIVERQELNEKKPTFNLTITADERLYNKKLDEYNQYDNKN